MLDTNKERVQEVLSHVAYNDWHVGVGVDDTRLYLQVRFIAPDEDTGEAREWNGRKWLLSPHMTDSELVFTAWLAIKTAVEHEARETFMYKGRKIFGPHISVEALHRVADQIDARA